MIILCFRGNNNITVKRQPYYFCEVNILFLDGFSKICLQQTYVFLPIRMHATVAILASFRHRSVSPLFKILNRSIYYWDRREKFHNVTRCLWRFFVHNIFSHLLVYLKNYEPYVHRKLEDYRD